MQSIFSTVDHVIDQMIGHVIAVMVKCVFLFVLAQTFPTSGFISGLFEFHFRFCPTPSVPSLMSHTSYDS